MEEKIITIRRELHQIPEIGWNLPKTSAYIEKSLKEMNLSYRKIRDTGFIVHLKSQNKDAKTIIFRTDMDALNVTEEYSSEYMSTHPGKMHACGHDGHMAMMLSFLERIKEKELPCNIVVLFQPAEENMIGAKVFLDEPELKGALAIFAIHLWTPIDSGKVCLGAGPRMSSADNFEICFKGHSSHGGEPHCGTDSLVAACSFVHSVQSIISRRVDPNDKAVITIGSIHGGTAHNILATHVDLTGTVRTSRPELRKQIPVWIKKMCHSIASAYEVQGEMKWIEGTPTTINHPLASSMAEQAAKKIMGENAIIDFPTTGAGEDFALYMEHIPGCMILLGAKTEEYYPHHHPRFNINEEVLKTGSSLMEQIVMDMNTKKD